ncbi:MAG: hypothetical protein LBD17_03265 [Endomicrobium sp.]|jgi:hypothetical protein|nr:hypothetical protein [Endomicrobium sp.]
MKENKVLNKPPDEANDNLSSSSERDRMSDAVKNEKNSSFHHPNNMNQVENVPSMAQTQKSTLKSHTNDFGDLVSRFEAPQRAS